MQIISYIYYTRLSTIVYPPPPIVSKNLPCLKTPVYCNCIKSNVEKTYKKKKKKGEHSNIKRKKDDN